MADSTDSGPKWHELYRAALFEADASKLPSRIEEARKSLALRSRELFAYSGHNQGETEDMENALYALQALENCLRSKTKDRRLAARAG